MSVLIIAEVGVNHNGDIELAKRLIGCAADAGADVVKFQTFKAGSVVSKWAPKADYQKKATDPDQGQYEMIHGLELSRKDHELLVEECKKRGIDFFSTAFDTDSLTFLLDLGLNFIKIPSGELTNLPMLRHVSRLSKPVLISTGMANLGEIEAAIDVICSAGLPRNLITLLHCTTEYPAPIEDVNLKAMINMRAAFGVNVGYSDHTLGIEVPIAAVALGASVIEKHLTLDCNLPGPDHSASLEPDAFGTMVSAIRKIEMALGDGIKRPFASEARNRLIARRSLVASRAIKAGEPFSEDNITSKRPGTGISPMRWDEVVGRLASKNFDADELIEI